MNFLTSILLGILQGLTEFLPVSSSGHLVLAQYFFGLEESGDLLLEVFLHLGTLFAVLVYFRQTLWNMLVSLVRWRNPVQSQTARHNRTLVAYLILATLATGIVYLLVGDFMEALYSNPLAVCAMLLVTGAIVFASDFFKANAIPASEMGALRSIVIGFCQGVAIIPGISRSGSTIAAGLFTGVRREDAANFSFLLSIPAILAANLSYLDQFRRLSGARLTAYLAGFLAAFAVGYLVISVLIQLIKRARLKYFAFYCWLVGALGIAFILWL